jgi:hypothetical protein
MKWYSDFSFAIPATLTSTLVPKFVKVLYVHLISNEAAFGLPAGFGFNFLGSFTSVSVSRTDRF